MREVRKFLLAVGVAVLLTTGLVACGGDDSDEPKTGSAPTTTEQQTAPTTTPDDSSTGNDSGKQKEPADDSGGATEGSESSAGGNSGSGSAGSANSGSGSAGSSNGVDSQDGEPVLPSHENGIKDFGEEASEAERRAASTVVLAFMRGRAAGDWATVCSHMSATSLQPVEQIASKMPQYKGKGCAEILALLTGQAPESFRSNTMKGGVESLRVEADRGFAIFQGTDGSTYWLPLVKEGGQWKAGLLAPRTLPD